MSYPRTLHLAIYLACLLFVTTAAQAQTCTSHADCDDGVFCNGTELCSLGMCSAVVSACPPNQSGCVIYNGECDEDNDTCIDIPDYQNCVEFSGQVRSTDGTPICALVLINGRHEFSCGAQQGRYRFLAPPDLDGNATLFAFAHGFLPYRTKISPQSIQVLQDAVLSRGDSAPRPLVSLWNLTPGPGEIYAKLQGWVSTREGVPVSALVLANGSFQFTPLDSGWFELTTVLDGAGHLTLFAFADGFAPHHEILSPTAP